MNDHIRQLIHGYLDDLLTSEEFVELQGWLAADPQHAREFADLSLLHDRLHAAFHPELDRATVDLIAEGVVSFDLPGRESLVKRQGTHSRRTLLSAGLLASSLMILLAAWLLSVGQNDTRQPVITEKLNPSHSVPVIASNESPTATVTLASESRAVFFRDRTPIPGEPLQHKREYSLTSGSVELKFPTGAIAILEGPAIFEVNVPETIKVSLGNISVYAPEGAQGFQVLTPVAEVLDLGTRFHVYVDQSGQSQVQVIEGEAEVASLISGSSKRSLLTQGHVQRIQTTGDVDDSSLNFRPEDYLARLRDRVISYESIKDRNGGALRLSSVTVQRNGDAQTYESSELIGANVISFTAEQSEFGRIVVEEGFQEPIESLLHYQDYMSRGLTNLDGMYGPMHTSPVLPETPNPVGPLTPGLGIRFDQPIVNAPGPDVLVFEMQALSYPAPGDAFYISPLRLDDGLHSLLVTEFDISLGSPLAQRMANFELREGQKNGSSLSAILSSSQMVRLPQLQQYILAVAVDLSDLGYGPNQRVEGVFLHDPLTDPHRIDPVLIVGLPMPNSLDP